MITLKNIIMGVEAAIVAAVVGATATAHQQNQAGKTQRRITQNAIDAQVAEEKRIEAEAEQAKKDAVVAEEERIKRNKTILTSNRGVESKANTQQKKLGRSSNSDNPLLKTTLG